MEPLGEGRPLLSVQDLENRLVFTKCKVLPTFLLRFCGFITITIIPAIRSE